MIPFTNVKHHELILLSSTMAKMDLEKEIIFSVDDIW
jgi:hypothetical protein